VGLVVAATKFVDGGDFWQAVHRFEWRFALPILALTVGYVLIKGWRFVYQMRQLTDARAGVIMRAYVAGQSCTVLPGGMAARAGLLEQAGVPVADSAASIALSSLSDHIVLILCAVLSALWFDAARKPALIFLSVLTVVSVFLGIEATRTWLLQVIERLMGKVRLLDHWRDFLASVRQVTTWPVLLGGLGNAALAFVLMVEALDLAGRGVGAAIPYPTLLLAFALPTALGRISAMPGGVGVTEAGMVGILDATPGVTLDQAAAAVLVFRAGTVLFAALLGAVVYLVAWRDTREARGGRVLGA
jgi:uncharacterized membrane protein YbhN (UPF0104 family)